jgi:hypothetical protein
MAELYFHHLIFLHGVTLLLNIVEDPQWKLNITMNITSTIGKFLRQRPSSKISECLSDAGHREGRHSRRDYSDVWSQWGSVSICVRPTGQLLSAFCMDVSYVPHGWLRDSQGWLTEAAWLAHCLAGWPAVDCILTDWISWLGKFLSSCLKWLSSVVLVSLLVRILSLVLVTIDGVWIGDWICWSLTSRNCKWP